MQLIKLFETCSKSQKCGIWVWIGQQMGMTANKVHDYYYNYWQMQFFDSPNRYRDQLKTLYSTQFDPKLTMFENMANSSKTF